MSLLRRLLLVGGGTGGFTPPPPPDDFAGFELAAAPSGGWTWFNDPRAISYGGFTYIGYINGSGDVGVLVIDESDLSVASDTILHAALQVDDHDNAALVIRPSDHKLVTYYSPHISPSAYYTRVSTTSLDTDPTLSGGFAGETNLDGPIGGENYTYANPIYLTNADGVAADTLWLFHREHVSSVAGWWYAESNDYGTTFTNVHLHNVTYSRVVGNGTNRIDVCVTTHPNGSDDADVSKVRHLYREAAAWHQSDGTTIGGGVPIAKTSMTTVYDSGGDPVWIWDIAYGADGHPRIAFTVYPSTTDHRYWWARWTGSAWDAHEVAAGGTYLPTSAVGANPIEAYYSGGMALDHSDTNVAWCAVGLGSDEWEMRRYVTSNDGATWSHQVVSTGGKNARPYGVRDHGDALQAVWWRGDYANYIDYDVATWGAGAGGDEPAGDWFGLAYPWDGRPAFATYDEAPAGQMWISGDQGGAVIEQLTFSSRAAGVNVIVLDNVTNLTLRDIDFDEVPECIYAEGGGEGVVIERIRARNIYGPYTRTTFHSGNLVQWKNPGPAKIRDLKVSQPNPEPGGFTAWGTEDIISLGGDTVWGGTAFNDTDALIVERFAFDGGDWQSPSGTGLFVGDGDLVGGDGRYVWVRDGILLNPGQCAIGTGEQGPYRFERISIEGIHGGENTGLQVRSADVELGDVLVDWPNADPIDPGAPAWTDLGGNDFSASLSLSVTL